MKKIMPLLIVLWVIIVWIAGYHWFFSEQVIPNNPIIADKTISDNETFQIDLSTLVYKEVVDAEVITVNGESITIENAIEIWSILEDISLDKPTWTFDTIETIKLSNLEGYTMIYSIPSLDTPVCTKQTKQIEFAWKTFSSVNFVTISHDMPFALERFCGENNIDNVLTLSDARTKQFAQNNWLYMKEFGLMTRAVIIVDNEWEVVYIDYADEVTKDVDLLNAFAFLQTL